jgi:hypothetical protein
MQNQSLSDAYEIIRLHLSKKGGLMSQVEQGLEVDEAKVQELGYAIERVALEWRNLSLVPKPVVQLFCNLFSRLEHSIRLYPSKEPELRNLYYKFVAWIDHLFTEEPLSEEAAIAIVHQQIGGLQPLALELRQGERLQEGSLDLFYVALDRLAELWQSKDHVSKLAAGAMINAQEVFISLIKNYTSKEQQQLKEIEQQVTSRIIHCLM